MVKILKSTVNKRLRLTSIMIIYLWLNIIFVSVFGNDSIGVDLNNTVHTTFTSTLQAKDSTNIIGVDLNRTVYATSTSTLHTRVSTTTTTNRTIKNKTEYYTGCKIFSGVFSFIGLFFPCSCLACLSCFGLFESRRILKSRSLDIFDSSLYEPLVNNEDVEEVTIRHQTRQCGVKCARVILLLFPSMLSALVFGIGVWFACEHIMNENFKDRSPNGKPGGWWDKGWWSSHNNRNSLFSPKGPI